LVSAASCCCPSPTTSGRCGYASSPSLIQTPDARRLAPVAAAWERLNRAATDTATYNLERKPLVFSVFSLLADAARG